MRGGGGCVVRFAIITIKLFLAGESYLLENGDDSMRMVDWID